MKKLNLSFVLILVTSIAFAQITRSKCITKLNKLVKEIKIDLKTSNLSIEKAADNYNHKEKINL
jgi:hypothetical protein